MASLTVVAGEKGLLDRWLEIGRRNSWIRLVHDPPFSEKSFHCCRDKDELKDKLQQTWCLGQAFYLGNLCFINQDEGGGEWLVIRGELPFETVSHWAFLDEGFFEDWLIRVLVATDEQLRSLDY